MNNIYTMFIIIKTAKLYTLSLVNKLQYIKYGKN